MGKYIKSPFFAVTENFDHILFSGMTSSFKVRSENKIAVLKKILSLAEQPISKAELASFWSGSDLQTAQKFFSFLIEQRIIIPLDSKLNMENLAGEVSFPYIDGENPIVSSQKVGIICQDYFTEIVSQIVPDFSSLLQVDILSIPSSDWGNNIEQFLAKDFNLIVCVLPNSKSDFWNKLNQFCFLKKQNWFPISFQKFNSIIGPIIIPSVTPCWKCIENRKHIFAEEAEKMQPPENILPIKYYPKVFIKAVLLRSLQHCADFIINGDKAYLVGQEIQVNWATYAERIHRVFFFPDCEVCGC